MTFAAPQPWVRRPSNGVATICMILMAVAAGLGASRATSDIGSPVKTGVETKTKVKSSHVEAHTTTFASPSVESHAATAAHARFHATPKLNRAGRDPLFVDTDSPIKVTPSWSLCDGSCCEPLHRNRTCAFGGILFRPPNSFIYFADDPSATNRSSLSTFLSPRFTGGRTLGLKSHGLWEPEIAPLSAAGNITRVITSPLFIGGGLHRNPGHNMLDCVYPTMVSIFRLRDAAFKSQHHLALSSLPTPAGDFTYLYFDEPWCCKGDKERFNRGTRERNFTETVVGRVLDLLELRKMCPGSGCLVKSAFVGIGHMGMCMVDEQNVMGGARVNRSLWEYRQRVLARYGLSDLTNQTKTRLPPTMDNASASQARFEPPLVLFIETKRIFTNFRAVAASVENSSSAKTMVVRWEGMSFPEQLALLQKTAVHVTGVGTGQMNVFFLPAGSVALGLGWRNNYSFKRIHYFDPVLTSLDHVSVMYYPSYDESELGSPAEKSVTLNVSKSTSLILSALKKYETGFEIPVRLSDNANDYERAYEYLSQLSGGVSHMQRTGDTPWEWRTQKCLSNNVETLLFTRECGWKQWIPQVLDRYKLGPAICNPEIGATAMCSAGKHPARNGLSAKKDRTRDRQGERERTRTERQGAAVWSEVQFPCPPGEREGDQSSVDPL